MDSILDLSVEERVEIFFRYAKSRDAAQVVSDFNEKYGKIVTEDVVVTLFHRFLRTGSVLEESPDKIVRRRRRAFPARNRENLASAAIKQIDEYAERPPACNQRLLDIKSESAQETLISEVKEEQPAIYYPNASNETWERPCDEAMLKVKAKQLLEPNPITSINRVQQPPFKISEPVSLTGGAPQVQGSSQGFLQATGIKTEATGLPNNEPVYVEAPTFTNTPVNMVKIKKEPGMAVDPPLNPANMQHLGYMNNYSQRFQMSQHPNHTHRFSGPVPNQQGQYPLGNPNTYGSMPMGWNQPRQIWNQAPQYNYNQSTQDPRLPMFFTRDP